MATSLSLALSYSTSFTLNSFFLSKQSFKYMMSDALSCSVYSFSVAYTSANSVIFCSLFVLSNLFHRPTLLDAVASSRNLSRVLIVSLMGLPPMSFLVPL